MNKKQFILSLIAVVVTLYVFKFLSNIISGNEFFLGWIGGIVAIGALMYFEKTIKEERKENKLWNKLKKKKN